MIKSYLTNRFQYVQFAYSESGLREIKTGIPQGSILGPLFFSIVINDLVNSSTKFRFLVYADDTTIYFNLDDFPLVNREIEINCEPEKVNTWLKLNKLSINVDKTKCMFFHKRRSITPLMGVFKGGGSGGSNPPPEIFRFFLKSEGKEIERKRKKRDVGGGGYLLTYF